MKLSLSSFSWFNHTIDRAIELTAELGYEGIELQGNRPHLLPTDFTKEEVHKIREKLDDAGIQCACITAFDGTYYWCLSHPEERIYRSTIEHVKRCIEYASLLGAKVVESVTGMPLIVEDDREAAWARVRDAYIELVETAEKFNVLIGLENEVSNCVETIDDTIRMIKEVNSPYLGALLDLGHANLESYMTVSDGIRKLAPWLIHVHADDNNGVVHKHLPVGEGTIDWELAIKTLRAIGYNGWVTVEMEHVADPMAASAAALRILRQNLANDSR